MLTDATAAEAERARVDEALHVATVAPDLHRLLGAVPRAVHVLDAKYRPGDRCTVLYEADGRLVTGRLDLAAEGPPAALRLTAFPRDPALPALPAVLDGPAIARRLTAALGWPVRRCRPRLVRYRPDRRATVRLDVVGGGEHRTLFAKVYHDANKARRVHDAMAALHPALAGSGLAVAAPLAHLADLAVVVQAPLPGRPLDDRHVAAAGTGLAVLHHAGVVVDRPRSPGLILEKAEGRAHRVAAVAPATGAALLELADRLRATAAACGVGTLPPVLVHGDCKPRQFVVDAGRVGLLDFDHVGTAEPTLDVGAFLAAPQGAPAGRDLLAGYVATGGSAAVLAPAASWYRALALLTKAERAFARSWRSPRPAALLADAARSLDDAGTPR